MMIRKIFGMYRQTLFICFAVLGLSGCSGGGSCHGCNNNAAGTLNLSITSPVEYPAGVPVTAYLIITNTSGVDATNLTYPPIESNDPTNHTGVTITVNPTGVANQNCSSIVAGASCAFTATIPAGSIPGSFTVTATGSAGSQTILNSVKSAIGVQNTVSISVTTNLGLTSIPYNKNQLYVLPGAQVINTNQTESTLVMFSVLVESAFPLFNTITLESSDGSPIPSARLISESPVGNYGIGNIATFSILLPPGESSTQYVQAVTNGNVSESSNIASINYVPSKAGIMSISPSYSVLNPNNTTQIYTVSNNGSAPISGNLPLITAPLNLTTNNCGSGTEINLPAAGANSSCTFTVAYNPESTAAVESFVATYNNGASQTESAIFTIYYNLGIVITTSLPDNLTSSQFQGFQITATYPMVFGSDTVNFANADANYNGKILYAKGNNFNLSESCIVSYASPCVIGVLPILAPSSTTANESIPQPTYAVQLSDVNGTQLTRESINYAVKFVGFNMPAFMSFSLDGTKAFISDREYIYGIIEQCSVDNGTLYACGLSNLPPFFEPTSLSSPAQMSLNPSGTYMFIANYQESPGVVSVCTVDGIYLENCIDSGASGIIRPQGITLNSTGTIAYVSSNYSNSVYACNVDESTLSGCVNTEIPGLAGPSGMLSKNNLLYITNNNSIGNFVTVCQESGTNLINCSNANSGFNFPNDLAFSLNESYAFVSNWVQPPTVGSGYISICSASEGIFTNCNANYVAGLLSEDIGISINPAGTNLFIVNYQTYEAGNGGAVISCNINESSLSGCSKVGY